MPVTTTGFNRHLDLGGSHAVNELLRQGAAIVAEVNAEPIAAPAAAQTFNILRRVQVAAGDPTIGVPPTYVDATGLNAIKGSVILPADWNKTQVAPGLPMLRETERVVHLVDVPGNAVLTTDRIEFSDPVYGLEVFTISEAIRHPGTNIVRLTVEWARERVSP